MTDEIKMTDRGPARKKYKVLRLQFERADTFYSLLLREVNSHELHVRFVDAERYARAHQLLADEVMEALETDRPEEYITISFFNPELVGSSAEHFILSADLTEQETAQ